MTDSSSINWSFSPLLTHPVRLWLAACYNVTALPVAAVTFSLIIAMLSTSVGLLITFVIALPFAWLTFVLARGFGHFERGRAAALAGVRIDDPVPPLTSRGWWGRLKERAKSRPRWQEIAYQLAHLPVGGDRLRPDDGGVVRLAGNAACCRCTSMRCPGTRRSSTSSRSPRAPVPWRRRWSVIAGLVFVAPWVTVGVARVSVAMARALLGPSADAAHAAQVQRLETSRSAAVDSAEAERRRIERDLHDGAQQRLVALAAGLGAAKEKIDVDPEEGGACSPTPTRRRNRRSRRSAISSAASTR